MENNQTTVRNTEEEQTKTELDKVTEDVLKVIDSYGFKQEGAYNLRTERHGSLPRRQPSYPYHKEGRQAGH